jgi:ketosteroid isomerase-like protein
VPDAGPQGRIDDLFAAIDARDVDSFLRHLREDASFRFGSAPPASGHAAIRDAVGGFFESIAALSHTVSKTLVEGSTVVCEGTVTYTRHDGSQLNLPFVDVLEMEGSLISDYKIYMDIGPLYAA